MHQDVGDGKATPLVEGDIGDAAGFGLIEIVAAGIAAIGAADGTKKALPAPNKEVTINQNNSLTG
jgi:hypothetical protein